MREMVGAELGFKAVGCRLTGREGHNASVINKYVKDFALGFEFLGSLVNLARVSSASSVCSEIYSSIRFQES